MAVDKSRVMQMFRKDPDKYWKVSLFEGWHRQQCKSCKQFFWSLEKRDVCGNPPCGPYSFLGKPPTKKKMDYIDTWKAVEKFFAKNGHASLPRYPVICRWFPGLYFTIASVINFQRYVGNETVFELPANPVIVPQPCLRFNDIPNIGVSGRHFSSFVMIGQLSMPDTGGYWKDETIDLDHRLLTEVFGIKENKITYVEDIWAGPNAFGASLEYYVDGLELGNAVFTEFLGTPDKYRVMDRRIIDMGAGHERLAWLTQGTPTAYDAAFGPVVSKLIKATGTKYDKKFFLEYSKLAGRLNADEVDIDKARAAVAKQLGVSVKEMTELVDPIQAIYGIADHSRTLAFAIADGGIPSNVGGGYNLRVILRRALDLIDEHSFSIDLAEIAGWHADYLRPMFGDLRGHKPEFHEIIGHEKKKYAQTMEKARRTIRTLVEKKERIDTPRLVGLYESLGISPELLQAEAAKLGHKVSIPGDFYSVMTERHMSESVGEKSAKEDTEITQLLKGLPQTEILYYIPVKEFDAQVLKNFEYNGRNWLVLDKTGFYPTSGGQDHDTGWIDGQRVNNVMKVGRVVIHQADKPVEGLVHGRVDWERRTQLKQHHTGTHVVNGACRALLGGHAWQAGAHKEVEKAHLDITHYENLTEEQMEKIEALSNKVVREKRKIVKKEMPRAEAEAKYGFLLYQGGAVPAARFRVINITDWDVEQCGGTHADNTEEVGEIVITGAEKISDGIVRVHFVAGNAAERFLAETDSRAKETAELLLTNVPGIPKAVEKLLGEWKAARKKVEEVERKKASKLEWKPEKVRGVEVGVAVVDGNMEFLRTVSKTVGKADSLVVLLGVSDRIYVFAAAGEKVRANAGQVVRQLCQEFGGGGGGPPAKGEGSIPISRRERVFEISAAAKRLALEAVK
jgi:alanyl-tRNA synthetase